MSDDPLTDCPDCDKPELRKLMSAPNFRLKGGGWYETDFKDKNQRNLAGGSDAKGPDKDSGKGAGLKGSEKNPAKDSAKQGSKADSKPASSKSSGTSSGSSD